MGMNLDSGELLAVKQVLLCKDFDRFLVLAFDWFSRVLWFNLDVEFDFRPVS